MVKNPKKKSTKSSTTKNTGTVFSRTRKFIFKWTVRIFIAFLLISFLQVLLLKYLPVVYTPLMIMRKYEAWKFGKKNNEIKYTWKSYGEISDKLPMAILASEDQLFNKHFGVDLKAMQKAYENNKRGKKVKGASTISQQVAKNVFLVPNRSYIRKAFELYYTFLIELIWSKQRILETYLNVAEMGDMIFGAEATALNYFNKSASKLSASESALIAAVLPNPRKYFVKQPSTYVISRQTWILKQMSPSLIVFE